MTFSSTIGHSVALVGSGSATPRQVVTNDQLAQRVETTDEWISTRTGIKERRVSAVGESVSALSATAANAALQMAGWDPDSVDLIVLATSTPDDLFGSAPKVQSIIGAKNAFAFDLTAACSGFLFGLVTASQYLSTGSMRRALVIGSDQLTSWMDWDDRRSCVLFGDGAGAIALERTTRKDNVLIGFQLKSDGSRGQCLNLPQKNQYKELVGNISHHCGGFSNIQMNGQEVYKFAVREVPNILKETLKTYQVDSKEIDWLLLHQANQRILDAVADRLKLSQSKVLSNLSKYGNTSAATIPLVFDESIRSGKVKPGDLIATSGFGAGLSWGAALFRWAGPT